MNGLSGQGFPATRRKYLRSKLSIAGLVTAAGMLLAACEEPAPKGHILLNSNVEQT